MKQSISLVFAAVLAMILCACGPKQEPVVSETDQGVLTDDSSYIYRPDDGSTPPNGAGARIAFAADASGDAKGSNAAAWRGVTTFADSYGFEALDYIAEEDTAESAAAALRQAAESDASMVVCRGEAMAAALYEIQSNYPTVSYLLLDDEPHSRDFKSYITANNVHCILFQEEQAGFLAGYAAVMEGYTSLGYLGAEKLPGVVRYGTGFLQGAQAAAERQGVEVYLKMWYCNAGNAGEEITARMSGWYSEGTQLILSGGGALSENCVAAAQQTGGKVIAAEWDQNSLGEQVLTSAVKCQSLAVQQALYSFYAGGHSAWTGDKAGQTERVGVSTGAVGLTTGEWRMRRFSLEQYSALYESLRNSTLKAERYSDADILPQTPNVAVDLRS